MPEWCLRTYPSFAQGRLCAKDAPSCTQLYSQRLLTVSTNTDWVNDTQLILLLALGLLLGFWKSTQPSLISIVHSFSFTTICCSQAQIELIISLIAFEICMIGSVSLVKFRCFNNNKKVSQGKQLWIIKLTVKQPFCLYGGRGSEEQWSAGFFPWALPPSHKPNKFATRK